MRPIIGKREETLIQQEDVVLHPVDKATFAAKHVELLGR
jgi:hypothetical protein